jgi:putative membrane protein
LIALAVAGLLAGCSQDEPTSPPAPTTAPDNTMSPAAPPPPIAPEATTPPAAPEATTPPPGTPEPTPSVTPAPPAPDNTNPGTAPGGTEPPPATPGSGSSRLDSPGATLAKASSSALRDRYGVDLTRVADEKADAADTNTLSRSDRNFVEDALKGGLYEETAAKVGIERARSPSVKAFAEMLASQHGAANVELKQLASTWNVDIPDKLPLMKRRAVDNLREAKDADFEQEFIKQVGLDDHKEDIKRFEKAAREAKDPSIRAWAEKTLPTLREHLAAARDLAVASGIKIETENTARSSTSGTTANGGTGS